MYYPSSLSIVCVYYCSRTIQDRFPKDQTAELCCAVSLSQALTRITKKTYCLLMIDLRLPGVQAIEMVRILRVTKHDPILALTELEAGKKVMLFYAGVSAFIEKSVNADICITQADIMEEQYKLYF